MAAGTWPRVHFDAEQLSTRNRPRRETTFDAKQTSTSTNLGATQPGMTTQVIEAPESTPDHEQKRAALGYLHEAWVEARIDGIDGDCLAQACLFAAFAEFVSTYGEEAAARFAEGLAVRIRNGEFSLAMARQ
jgi:hypothetical protein